MGTDNIDFEVVVRDLETFLVVCAREIGGGESPYRLDRMRILHRLWGCNQKLFFSAPHTPKNMWKLLSPMASGLVSYADRFRHTMSCASFKVAGSETCGVLEIFISPGVKERIEFKGLAPALVQGMCDEIFCQVKEFPDEPLVIAYSLLLGDEDE